MGEKAHKYILDALGRVFHYAVYERNPILKVSACIDVCGHALLTSIGNNQIFYLTVVGGAYTMVGIPVYLLLI